jgi:hypothetical protein
VATEPVEPMEPIGPTNCGGPGQPACQPVVCVKLKWGGGVIRIHGAAKIEPVLPSEQEFVAADGHTYRVHGAAKIEFADEGE